jgi:hypothetical protein
VDLVLVVVLCDSHSSFLSEREAAALAPGEARAKAARAPMRHRARQVVIREIVGRCAGLWPLGWRQMR